MASYLNLFFFNFHQLNPFLCLKIPYLRVLSDTEMPKTCLANHVHQLEAVDKKGTKSWAPWVCRDVAGKLQECSKVSS